MWTVAAKEISNFSLIRDNVVYLINSNLKSKYKCKNLSNLNMVLEAKSHI